ncbi:MAG: glycogen synthase GlgA [Candidatus Omnitrophica bacterium]|nr:glycogen synthase GlgA [Candidatus Omnitrophota bacterium]
MHITFCAAEAVPFAQTGGLGDVCGSLPLALEKKGVGTTIFMPRYKSIDRQKFGITPIDEHTSKGVLGKNIDVYFIEHEFFGGREGIYGDGHGDYHDNLERFQFLCDQTLKTIEKQRLKTDIIHCHDWHTALVPVYGKEHYRQSSLATVKHMLTIHNLAHQGVFRKDKFPKLHLRKELFSTHGLEFFDQINFLKGGIIFSDEVTTVSKQYAREILTQEFGCGLEDVIRSRPGEVDGILNGINDDLWDPATDPLIARTYTARSVAAGKAANKKKLQELLHLPQRDDVPVFSFVSRLVHQKGVDIILEALEEILTMNVQVVVLGAGETRYQKQVHAFAEKYPQRLWAKFHFDDALAHQVYAGSDWFLMPSRFEPCGLSQMISFRYGTIPLAFKTGGLVDTVVPFDPTSREGNGVLFEHFTKTHFLHAFQKAVDLFYDRHLFDRLRQNAMAADFSWEHAAEEYIKVYQCLLSA